MAAIQLTPELAIKLVGRYTREYAETAASNFALDIIVDDLNAECAKLREFIIDLQGQNLALQERSQRAEADNELLREQLDEKRKGRFRDPHQNKPD